MLLRKLQDEKKSCFLVLAKAIMSADGEIHEKEKELFDEICYELNVNVELYVKKNYDETLRALTNMCSTVEKRLIMFELLSMACVDKYVNEAENTYLKNIKTAFKINDTDYNEMLDLSIDLLDIQQDIRIAINRESR